ncbi:hypothetical protein BGZ95_010326 [Linnemannia exigua]|uniref:Uncharacterized protein n=1 Tax=Linnemannia exigua TaxID=604196 RepID=A0AAD4DBJ7_9FUNG|nr:hypothetical protein BGZ95_010326 [Linnemannia exigua]
MHPLKNPFSRTILQLTKQPTKRLPSPLDIPKILIRIFSGGFTTHRTLAFALVGATRLHYMLEDFHYCHSFIDYNSTARALFTQVHDEYHEHWKEYRHRQALTQRSEFSSLKEFHLEYKLSCPQLESFKAYESFYLELTWIPLTVGQHRPLVVQSFSLNNSTFKPENLENLMDFTSRPKMLKLAAMPLVYYRFDWGRFLNRLQSLSIQSIFRFGASFPRSSSSKVTEDLSSPHRMEPLAIRSVPSIIEGIDKLQVNTPIQCISIGSSDEPYKTLCFGLEGGMCLLGQSKHLWKRNLWPDYISRRFKGKGIDLNWMLPAGSGR